MKIPNWKSAILPLAGVLALALSSAAPAACAGTKVGAFTVPSGAAGSTITITLGFEPKVFICWWSGRTEDVDTVGNQDSQAGFGVALSATNRRLATSRSNTGAPTTGAGRGNSVAAVVGIVNSGFTAFDGLLDVDAILTDGIRLVVDQQFGRVIRVHYLALSADEIDNAALGTVTEPAATGTQATSGLGFAPNGAIFFGINVSTSPPTTTTSSLLLLGAAVGTDNVVTVRGGSSGTASGTHDRSYGKIGECIANPSTSSSAIVTRAKMHSFDADGFTLDWLERSGSRQIFYLALKAKAVALKPFTTATDTTPFSVTTGFQTAAGLVSSTTQAENTVDLSTPHSEHSFGAFTSATERGAQAWRSADEYPTNVTTAVEHDEVYVKLSNGAVADRMDVTSISSTAVEFTMEGTSTAALAWLLAFKTEAAAGGAPARRRIIVID